MTNREFAEVNAGKSFLYDGDLVKVVGYLRWDRTTVLLQAKIGHWSGKVLDSDQVFTHKVDAKRFKNFRYAQVDDVLLIPSKASKF